MKIKLSKTNSSNYTMVYKYVSVISIVGRFRYYKIHKGQVLFGSCLVTPNKFICHVFIERFTASREFSL